VEVEVEMACCSVLFCARCAGGRVVLRPCCALGMGRAERIINQPKPSSFQSKLASQPASQPAQLS
jgi:hypothetical protein